MPDICENIITIKHGDPALTTVAKNAFLKEELFESFLYSDDEEGPRLLENYDVARDLKGILEETATHLKIAVCTAWGPPHHLSDWCARMEAQGFEIELLWCVGFDYCRTGGYSTREGEWGQYGYNQEIDDAFSLSDRIREELGEDALIEAKKNEPRGWLDEALATITAGAES